MCGVFLQSRTLEVVWHVHFFTSSMTSYMEQSVKTKNTLAVFRGIRVSSGAAEPGGLGGL